MNQNEKDIKLKNDENSSSINRDEVLSDNESPIPEISVDQREDLTETTKSEKTVSSEKYLQNFSIPKILYDIAAITFLLPTVLYLHAHMYKLGRFDFYEIPIDYLEVSYHDIVALWALPVVFLFIFLLPFYAFFIPSQVLEGLTSQKQSAKKDWTDSKWLGYIFKGLFLLLMTGVSGLILSNFDGYWDFVTSTYPLFAAFIFSTVLFWIQTFWDTKGVTSQKLMKIGSFVFSLLLMLISTTSIAQKMGKFQAQKKMNYERICSSEKNWIRVGKSGDKIIAKEIDQNTNTAAKKTLLIGSNCDEVIILENISIASQEAAK